MSAPAEITVRKGPSRVRWLVLGVTGGMLLFPLAAGLPYKESWGMVWAHTQEKAPVVWGRTEPYLARAWGSLKQAVRSARESWAEPDEDGAETEQV